LGQRAIIGQTVSNACLAAPGDANFIKMQGHNRGPQIIPQPGMSAMRPGMNETYEEHFRRFWFVYAFIAAGIAVVIRELIV
jgi:hypothetical protein